ncbi:hypothetical protein Tco_1401439 [Tanacetum coccineum]
MMYVGVQTRSQRPQKTSSALEASWKFLFLIIMYLLGKYDEGLSYEGTKLILTFLTAESPEEGVSRVIPEYGATKPQKGSATSFSPNNDHPTLTFVSQTGNTPKTIKVKPSERSELEEKPYPSPLPEQVSTLVVQQRA